MFKIEKLEETDREEIVNIMKIAFSKVINKVGLEIVVIENNDFSEDDLKITLNGKIIGFHIFDKESINKNIHGNDIEFVDNIELYKGKTGLLGFAMCILTEYQKIGAGTTLLNYEREHFKGKYDYIWGGQEEELSNIEFWKKHRKIVAIKNNKLNSTKTYYTVMDLKK